MKNIIAYILMGLYVILLFVGIIFDFSIFTNISTALAVFSFLYIQQPKNNTGDMQLEKRIVERSGNLSFLLIITVLIFGSILNDIIGFLSFVTLEELFQVIIGLGFMTFVSVYVYFSENK